MEQRPQMGCLTFPANIGTCCAFERAHQSLEEYSNSGHVRRTWSITSVGQRCWSRWSWWRSCWSPLLAPFTMRLIDENDPTDRPRNVNNFAKSNGFTHINLTQSAVSGLTELARPPVSWTSTPVSASHKYARVLGIPLPPKRCFLSVVALTYPSQTGDEEYKNRRGV